MKHFNSNYKVESWRSLSFNTNSLVPLRSHQTRALSSFYKWFLNYSAQETHKGKNVSQSTNGVRMMITLLTHSKINMEYFDLSSQGLFSFTMWPQDKESPSVTQKSLDASLVLWCMVSNNFLNRWVIQGTHSTKGSTLLLIKSPLTLPPMFQA